MYIKNYSASLITREVPVETTVTYHLTLISMPITFKDPKNRKQALATLWKNFEGLILLVGMQNDTASTKNSVETPNEIQHWTTVWSSISASAYLTIPIEIKISEIARSPSSALLLFSPFSHQNLMFLSTLFTVTEINTQSKCILRDEWIKTMWYKHTMGYYLAF